MEECYICGTSLRLFDAAASTHHLNTCMDAGASKVIASDSEHQSAGASVDCPICRKSFLASASLENHIESCLIMQSDCSAAVIEEPRDEDNIQEDDVCPCCFQSWHVLISTSESKDQHVADCLAQQAAVLEDQDSDTDDQANSQEARKLLTKGTLSNGFGRLRSNLKGKVRQDPQTPNLIPQLALLLERSFASSTGITRSAVLCDPNVVHVKSQFGDFGWGCGYKNAQMVFSAIRHVEQYKELLESHSNGHVQNNTDEEGTSGKRKGHSDFSQDSARDLPSIQELQEIAEKAWTTGFDPEGRLHFKGKLIGSRRWIGTSEVYVMYTWLGIRATVIDFPKSTSSVGIHRALTKWVFDYFNAALPEPDTKDAFGMLMASKGTSVRIAHDKLPLYLQHQGHSRTIVGVEVTKKGELNLILFDPGHKVPGELRNAALAGSSNKKPRMAGTASRMFDTSLHSKLLESFRVNLKSLSRKDEYQIIRIETAGGALSVDEKLERRVIKSIQVEQK